eukprot:CAMPEP_0185581294 /NCGR_PEP_ID=MMETSP0434-20130131/18219_1 /TAXON_ID=626734 ORGANISM="Favella taraikaensis, Strain Fe Narragansett Bay" /NCGR_SAMPLE_ID=MMETSP0434 /ASSEMBLY_ACC=CAM_ASM_000379 /LENGTH=74 /DNA_ID=CAMNT_0028199793 /DNA_START=558 /DNA_END=782 /DNA_ORIENTATION=-
MNSNLQAIFESGTKGKKLGDGAAYHFADQEVEGYSLSFSLGSEQQNATVPEIEDQQYQDSFYLPAGAASTLPEI